MTPPKRPSRGSIYDVRNPSITGELIGWLEPKHEERKAIVSLRGAGVIQIPERYAKFAGAKFTVLQQAELDSRGWTAKDLRRIAEGNGVTLEQAAEDLCE